MKNLLKTNKMNTTTSFKPIRFEKPYRFTFLFLLLSVWSWGQHKLLFEFGNSLETSRIENLSGCSAMDVSPVNGNIYIGGNNGISIFNSSNQFVSKFGGYGTGTGFFLAINAIHVSYTGDVYVSDNNRMQVFDANGNFIRAFGSSGTGNGQFDTPKGINVDQLGNIWVADSKNHRIQKFNNLGVYQSQFGVSGTGNGQFNEPTSLFVLTSTGRIYVSDSKNNRIQTFNLSGVYQSQFGTFGGGDGQFQNILKIDIFNNKIYAIDGDNYNVGSRIQVFSTTGTFLTKIDGQTGQQYYNSVGYLNDFAVQNNIYTLKGGPNPSQIYVLSINGDYLSTISNKNQDGLSANGFSIVSYDNVGNVYAAGENSGDFDIRVFSSNGSFLRKFGGFGNGNGQFREIKDIAVDNSGNIYVLDATRNDIQVFDSNGNFIRKFGDAIILVLPQTIKINTNGNILVSGPNQIKEFTPLGVEIRTVVEAGATIGGVNLKLIGPLSVDNSGNIYFYTEDGANSFAKIFKIDNVGNYISHFGNYGTNTGQMFDSYLSSDLEVGTDGKIYLYERGYNFGTNRIQVFNNSGTYLYKLRENNSYSYDFFWSSYPRFAINSNSETILANGDLYKFAPNGTFTGFFGNYDPYTNIQLGRCFGGIISTTSDIVLPSNNRIFIFSKNGVFKRQIASLDGYLVKSFGNFIYNLAETLTKYDTNGVILNRFKLSTGGNGYIQDFDIDANENVHVIFIDNSSNKSYQCYNNAGSLLNSFNFNLGPNTNGQFQSPSLIAYLNNKLYIGDANNSGYSIQVLNTVGGFLYKFQETFSGSNFLQQPTGLYKSSNNEIIITDNPGIGIWKYNEFGVAQAVINAQNANLDIFNFSPYYSAINPQGQIITHDTWSNKAIKVFSSVASSNPIFKNLNTIVGFSSINNFFQPTLINTTSAGITITIQNSTSAGTSLTLGGLSLGKDRNEFSVNTTGMLSVVSIGGTTSFSIIFKPTATGIRNLDISLNTNASFRNPYVFTFLGSGTGSNLPQSITGFTSIPTQSASTNFYTILGVNGGLSGNAVTFTSSNLAVATISGNVVNILSAGVTTITANQAGNASYQAATPLSQILNVTCPAVSLSPTSFSSFTFRLSDLASQSISITSMTGLPSAFTILGTNNLPLGVTFNTTSGLLFGTVSGQNANTTTTILGLSKGCLASRIYVTTVDCNLAVGPTLFTLLGIINSFYTTPFSVSGLTYQITPQFWDIQTGSLPLGIFINSLTGVVAGIPTTTGTGSFRVRANFPNSSCAANRVYGYSVSNAIIQVTSSGLNATFNPIISSFGSTTITSSFAPANANTNTTVTSWNTTLNGIASFNTVTGVLTANQFGNGVVRLQSVYGTITSNIINVTITNNDNAFVTEWNLAVSGSGANQLTFTAGPSGTVNYQWTTIPITTVSGSGSFTAPTASLTGLPTGERIRLSLNSTNFNRFAVNSSDANRLTNVAQWGNVTWTGTMASAFEGCGNLKIAATDIPNWAGVNNMANMFRNCAVLTIPSNINNWNTSAVTTMTRLFEGAAAFNQPIGGWNTSAVTNMSSMFNDATAFNQSIGGWNVSAVTNLNLMFGNASAFNQPIGNWVTNAVTDMGQMFRNATSFNQPIGSWNTSAVTSMNYMFFDATAFNQSIGGWNVSAVTNMNLMFGYAASFNQSIDGWNISAVNNMNSMFSNATSFDKSIGAWGTKLNSSVTLGNLLDNSGLSIANYEATLQGFSATTITGKTLGAAGRQYCSPSVARNFLTNNRSWTITGDASVAGVAIVTQPQSQNTCTGSNVGFSVSATGANLTYLWNNLATTRTITSNVVGNYTVTVSGTCGALVSNSVSLNSIAGVAIVTQPVSQSTCLGSNIGFSVSATGAGLTYLWNNSSITSTITSNIVGNYTVTVSGTCGALVSNTVSLNSIVGVAIVTQPQNTTILAGNFANLGVTALGTNLTYLWNSGQTTSSISTSVAGIYTVTVFGTCGNSVSIAVTITTILGAMPVTSATVSGPNTISVADGSITLTSAFSPANANTNTLIGWNTNPTSVATINGAGVLTALTDGIVTVSGCYNTVCGFNVITVSGQCIPVSITTQPISQTVCEGSLAALSVSAIGSSLSYLWSNGATTNSINTSLAGNYQVTVAGLCGVAVSNTATISTISGTSITGISQSQTICGPSAALSVAGVGQNVTYLWSNGNTTSNIVANVSGNYQVTVSGTCGVVVSNPIAITLQNQTQIVSHPISQTVCEGSFAALSVSATGSSLSYLWSNGATTNSINTSLAGNYQVTVAGTCSLAVSNVATISTISGTSITGISSSQTICGTSAALSVTAIGENLQYRWSNGNTTSNIIANVSGNYQVTVSGTCGVVVSNTIAITLQNQTLITSHPISQTVCEGSLATLSVSATDSNLSYLWSNGATTNSINTSLAGNYQVTVAGTCGLAVSNTATISTISGTNINGISQSQTICGPSAALSVTAIGENLQYRWSNGNTTSNIVANVSGNYTVTLSGQCGNAISSPITILLQTPTQITAEPQNASFLSGTSTSISVLAVGTNLSYLWSNGLNTSQISVSSGGIYQVTVSGTCGTLVSRNVIITEQFVDMPQTILGLNPISNKTYGDAPINLGIITATSGLPVSISVTSNPANNVVIFSNNQIIILGGGTVTVTATQVGNPPTYLPALPVIQVFAIAKVPLSVIGINTNRVYGTPNPSFQYSLFGFINGDVANNLDALPAANSVANATSDVGNYPIIISGGTDNAYQYEYTNATLSVLKSPNSFKILPKAVNISVGDSLTIGAEAQSGLPLIFQIQNPSVASLQNAKIKGLKAGQTNILVWQKSSINFDSLAFQSLAVNVSSIPGRDFDIIGSTIVPTGNVVTYSQPSIAGYSYAWSISGVGAKIVPGTENTPNLQVIFEPNATQTEVTSIVRDADQNIVSNSLIRVNPVTSAESDLVKDLKKVECPPEVTECKNAYITGVKLGKLSNLNTGCSRAGFGDYTLGLKLDTLMMGDAYDLNLQSITSNGKSAFFAVWIDYNNNGKFTDQDDFVAASFENANAFEIKNIIIKNQTEYEGPRRMRVSMRADAAIAPNDPCAKTGGSGETEDYLVFIRKPDDLQAASLVTPNNDGKNDRLIIRGINVKEPNKLTIMDRYGEMIYETTDYKNDWEGTNNQKKSVMDGTYYYFFVNGKKTISGFVELRRK